MRLLLYENWKSEEYGLVLNDVIAAMAERLGDFAKIKNRSRCILGSEQPKVKMIWIVKWNIGAVVGILLNKCRSNADTNASADKCRYIKERASLESRLFACC